MEASLIKKLKLESYKEKAIFKPSKEISNAFEGYYLPNYTQGQLNLALAFVYSLEEMKETILYLYENQILVEKGDVYLIYPKLKNKLGHPAIHRDAIFPFLQVDDDTGYIKGTNYKFNRMIALDENYTLVGVRNFPVVKTNQARKIDARISTYVDKVSDIVNYLKDFPKVADFYKSLTPGYQRDWARYVYSAKTEATIQKRLDEMIMILGKGYKTKELYQAAMKK